MICSSCCQASFKWYYRFPLRISINLLSWKALSCYCHTSTLRNQCSLHSSLCDAWSEGCSLAAALLFGWSFRLEKRWSNMIDGAIWLLRPIMGFSGRKRWSLVFCYGGLLNRLFIASFCLYWIVSLWSLWVYLNQGLQICQNHGWTWCFRFGGYCFSSSWAQSTDREPPWGLVSQGQTP